MMGMLENPEKNKGYISYVPKNLRQIQLETFLSFFAVQCLCIK